MSDEILIYYKALGNLQANCYFLINSADRNCVIVDAGDEPYAIREIIERRKLKPVALLLTHGHFDHIGAADEIRNAYHIDIYAGEDETELLRVPAQNLSAYFGSSFSLTGVKPVKDGELLELAGMHIRVIATPGHTKGGVCYYLEKQKALLTGDTLFYGSFGRTDFPTGNVRQLVQSVKSRLFTLPKDTVCYTGHGGETTIAYEQENNPIARHS